MPAGKLKGFDSTMASNGCFRLTVVAWTVISVHAGIMMDAFLFDLANTYFFSGCFVSKLTLMLLQVAMGV